MNPHRTLGLAADASADEIWRAYRSLAFRYHPDVNPEELSAERRFREVQRAYKILSDRVDEESKSPMHESEIERILERLETSITLTSGQRGRNSIVWISLGKACIRERSARREKPPSPAIGFVRPIPPHPPKPPRSPVSPVLF